MPRDRTIGDDIAAAGYGPLMTTDDLADYCNVTRRTVQNWRNTGRGPKPTRIGRYVRYRPVDVEEWLAEDDE